MSYAKEKRLLLLEKFVKMKIFSGYLFQKKFSDEAASEKIAYKKKKKIAKLKMSDSFKV